MKTRKIEIKVNRDYIRKLNDPKDKGHEVYHMFVAVRDLPLDLPTDINPRAQNLSSRVARQIDQGLIESPNVFNLMNRGLTITAFSAEYDNKSQTLTLEFTPNFGTIDGAHSYEVIKKNVVEYRKSLEKLEKDEKPEPEPEFMNAYVHIEVILGIKNDLLVDIAQSRNTSVQVKDQSLANLEGSFDWLKEELSSQPYFKQIAWRENEDPDEKPIDVREIIAILTMFHPNFQDGDNNPILAYASKGRALELFRDQPEGYQKLQPIIPTILRFSDYVAKSMESTYIKVGGLSGVNADYQKKTTGVKLAKVSEIRHYEGGYPLYFLNDTMEYKFPDGWTFPIIAAHRALCSFKTVVKFKVDVYKFYDRYATKLLQTTLEATQTLGRNPNAIGKNRTHWALLYEKCDGWFGRLINADREQEVKL